MLHQVLSSQLAKLVSFMNRKHPISTTITSNYASSSFPQGRDSDAFPASSYQSPYPSNVAPPSNSTLSFMSHGDPAIVDELPHHSSSADISHDVHSNISDGGTGINEMCSKHSLTLPMHHHYPSPALTSRYEYEPVRSLRYYRLACHLRAINASISLHLFYHRDTSHSGGRGVPGGRIVGVGRKRPVLVSVCGPALLASAALHLLASAALHC
jgi:hypothetical protein